jgi:uncharacterized protein (TIGR02598 family)
MKALYRRVAAFSLVEVTLALGIAAFCLIVVFGLLPVGAQTNRNAASQTAATSVIAAVIADMRATPRTSPTSSQFGVTFGVDTILYFDVAGQAATSMNPPSLTSFQPRYRMSVTFPSNGGLTYANLKVTWPAAVDPATITPSGVVEMFAAFDRN